MTSGKKRQLDPYLTDDERVELAEIDIWDEDRIARYRSVPAFKAYKEKSDMFNARFTAIYTAAERRRKIANLEKLA